MEQINQKEQHLDNYMCNGVGCHVLVHSLRKHGTSIILCVMEWACHVLVNSEPAWTLLFEASEHPYSSSGLPPCLFASVGVRARSLAVLQCSTTFRLIAWKKI